MAVSMINLFAILLTYECIFMDGTPRSLIIHGNLHYQCTVSAFMGKSGAFLATIVFSKLETPHIFFICGGVCCLGAIFTLFFSVDLTHVSLAEHDAQLELFLEGRVEDYKGKLNAPKHLSLYEKLTGKHGVYDPTWAMSLVKKDMEQALLGQQQPNEAVPLGEN